MSRIHSLRLSVNEFNVTSGNSTPREILCVRQPASLRQGGAMVLLFQNTDQHSSHFSSLQGKYVTVLRLRTAREARYWSGGRREALFQDQPLSGAENHAALGDAPAGTIVSTVKREDDIQFV